MYAWCAQVRALYHIYIRLVPGAGAGVGVRRESAALRSILERCRGHRVSLFTEKYCTPSASKTTDTDHASNNNSSNSNNRNTSDSSNNSSGNNNSYGSVGEGGGEREGERGSLLSHVYGAYSDYHPNSGSNSNSSSNAGGSTSGSMYPTSSSYTPSPDMSPPALDTSGESPNPTGMFIPATVGELSQEESLAGYMDLAGVSLGLLQSPSVISRINAWVRAYAAAVTPTTPAAVTASDLQRVQQRAASAVCKYVLYTPFTLLRLPDRYDVFHHQVYSLINSNSSSEGELQPVGIEFPAVCLLCGAILNAGV